jgi:hypothetical protein
VGGQGGHCKQEVSKRSLGMNELPRNTDCTKTKTSFITLKIFHGEKKNTGGEVIDRQLHTTSQWVGFASCPGPGEDGDPGRESWMVQPLPLREAEPYESINQDCSPHVTTSEHPQCADQNSGNSDLHSDTMG